MEWLIMADVFLEAAQNFLCGLFYALVAGLLAGWLTRFILERYWKGR